MTLKNVAVSRHGAEELARQRPSARPVGTRQSLQRFGKAYLYQARLRTRTYARPSQILLYCRCLYDPSKRRYSDSESSTAVAFLSSLSLLRLLPDGTDKFHAVTTNQRQQLRSVSVLSSSAVTPFGLLINSTTRGRSVGRGSFSDPSARRSFGD